MGKKNKHYKKSGIHTSHIGGTKLNTPPCHIGFTEVYKNVFVGKSSDILDVIDKVDVLVPLDSVSGSIWEAEWNGEIFYVPIKDYSVLPNNIEKQKVKTVLDRLKGGKKVAIFCLGGHGRTGYFASMVLGKLGVEDPIKLLREKYCSLAVETNEQVKAIADFLKKPNLIKEYPCFELDGYGDLWLDSYYASMYGGSYKSYGAYSNGYYDTPSETKADTCEHCINNIDEGLDNWVYCTKKCRTVYIKNDACEDFEK